MNVSKNDSIILDAVNKAIENFKNIVIAYSGGVDSTVLLHALTQIKKNKKIKVKAVHIHHGISENANNWVIHCQNQCNKWQIPLFVEHVNINQNEGNIEEQARIARYNAFNLHIDENCALCTAQHLDDQCETFLLALKRGSGLAGLSSMPYSIKKTFNNINYTHLRPLLNITREQIELYAQVNHLNWINDESNQNNYYDRNFLRLDILPKIQNRWIHFNKMVAKTALICQQQQNLIDELLQKTFNKITDESLNIDINLMKEEIDVNNEIKRNAILRMWFKKNNLKMPSQIQLSHLWANVFMAKNDANPTLVLGKIQIRRYKNKIYLLPLYQNISDLIINWNNINSALNIPDNIGLLSTTKAFTNCRLPQDNERVTVRFYASGTYKIVGRDKSRQLKKIWQEYNIPPWNRARIPLIFYNNTLISAVNLFVTDEGFGNEIGFILTQ